MTINLKLVPVEEEHTPLLISAHKSTQKLDTLTAYRRAYTYGPTKVVVKKDGNSKIVMSLPAGVKFACVPGTSTLSLGLRTGAIDPSVQPFTVEAAALITNASPPSAAGLAGATMLQLPVGGSVPTVPPVLTGYYPPTKQPGDVSWQGTNGKVVSWWGGGRYSTSVQLTEGTLRETTWADHGALGAGGGISPVRTGVPSLIIRAADNGETAGSLLYQSGDPPTIPVKMRYGVWLDGALLYDSKPGMGHMVRGETELWSLVAYQQEGNGVAVSFGLRRVTAEGVTTEQPLRMPVPDITKGASLHTRSEGGSWVGTTWCPHTCVLYDAINSIGDQDLYYSCYGHFSPDGTKVFIYGTTSGPTYLDPALMSAHVAADYRQSAVFVTDVPASLTEPVQMQYSTDIPPTYSAQTTSVTYPTVPVADTPDSFSVVNGTEDVWTTFTFGNTGGTSGVGRIKQVQVEGYQAQGVSTGTALDNLIESTVRTTSEITPYVDWNGTTLVSPRKVFVATRAYTREKWTRSSPNRRAKYTMWPATPAVNGGDPDTPIVAYRASGTYASAFFNTTTNRWESNLFGSYGTPIGNTTEVTTTIAYTSDGAASVITTTSVATRQVVGGRDQLDIDGYPGNYFGTPGSPSYGIFSKITKTYTTMDGSPVGDMICWTHPTPGRDPGTPFQNVGQVVGWPFNTAARPVWTGSGSVIAKRTDLVVSSAPALDSVDDNRQNYTVTYQFVLPNGVVAPPAMTPQTFFTNNYFTSVRTLAGAPTVSLTEFSFDVVPTYSQVNYADPRWPVVSLSSERLWDVYDGDNNQYFPGKLVNNGVMQHLYLLAPSEVAFDDTLPFGVPGYTYALVDPLTTLGTGPSQYKFANQSGPYLGSSFEEYVPPSSDAWTFRYVSGVYTAAPPRSAERYEVAWHYDISPDTSGRVLFGLPAWDASWPNGWGTTSANKKPALWTAAGQKFPLAVGGLYGEGVTYMSPLFLAPYRQV